MKVSCIAVLAFFFSLGFSQEPELGNAGVQSIEPPVAAGDTAAPANLVLVDEASSLDADASAKAAAKDACDCKCGGSSGDGLGWRDWTRLAAFTLAIASGVTAAIKHSDARMYKKDISSLEDNARKNGIYDGGSKVDDPYRERWISQYNDRKDQLEKNELYRNIFGISAGVFAVAGVVTFFF
jgi:hypothetical protein